MNHVAMQLAMRERLLSLTVCTTGVVTIAATSAGYTRATGSFIDDGFAAGMEITAAGFTDPVNNGVKIIRSVSATTIVCEEAGVVEAQGARSLTAGLPSRRSWENVEFEPTTGCPWVEEQYLPGPTPPAAGISEIELIPQYVPRVVVPQNTGLLARRYADAICNHFPAGLALDVAGENKKMFVRSDAGPFGGQLLRDDEWAFTPVTIPFRLRTQP